MTCFIPAQERLEPLKQSVKNQIAAGILQKYVCMYDLKAAWLCLMLYYH